MSLTEKEKDDKIAALERQVLLSKIRADDPAATSGTSSATSGVNAVTVKLPDFYENDAEMWFVRAECQFRTRGIKDDLTKFDYIVGKGREESPKVGVGATDDRQSQGTQGGPHDRLRQVAAREGPGAPLHEHVGAQAIRGHCQGRGFE